MSPRGEPSGVWEINYGLCELNKEQYLFLENLGWTSSATPQATIAMFRCIFCHAVRGAEMTADDIADCAGVNTETIRRELLIETENGFLVRTNPGKRPSPGVRFRYAATDGLVEIGKRFVIAETCLEVGG